MNLMLREMHRLVGQGMGRGGKKEEFGRRR